MLNGVGPTRKNVHGVKCEIWGEIFQENLTGWAREVEKRAFLISFHLSKASGVKIRAFPVQFQTFCANNQNVPN